MFLSILAIILFLGLGIFSFSFLANNGSSILDSLFLFLSNTMDKWEKYKEEKKKNDQGRK